MRVLVTTTAGTGHVAPTLPFALALRRAGHEIVWATAPEAHAAITGTGLEVRPAGIGLRERGERFRAAHPDIATVPPPQRRPIFFAGMFAELSAPAMASDLEPLLDELTPDLLVHEAAELAAAPLATARGIPHATIAFSGRLPESVRTAAVEAIAPVWESLGLDVPGDLGSHAHAYLHPFAPSLGQRPDESTVRDVGPPSAERAAQPGGRAARGATRPLVYLTFGTEMGPMAPWEPLLAGLATLDVDVLATTGAALEPEAVSTLVPATARARVRIERFVPQEIVLSGAAAVISHGGAGTMIAAGAAGLPQVVVPLGADQFDNAAAFTGAGAAVSLAATELDADLVTDQVRPLLDGSAVTRAARELAEEFAAMPDVDDVVATLPCSEQGGPLPCGAWQS